MNDDNIPNNSEEKIPETQSAQIPNLDFGLLYPIFVKLLLDPKAFWETIVGMVKSPCSFFTSEPAHDLNRAIGFWIVSSVYVILSSMLGALLQLRIGAMIVALPAGLVGAIVHVVIASVIVWLLFKFLLKQEIGFFESLKLVCFLSWTLLIGAFPLWVWFPGIVKGLMMAGGLMLFVYLLISAISSRYPDAEDKFVKPVWVAGGVFALLLLVGGTVGGGTGRSMDADSLIRQAQEDAQAAIEQAQSSADAANAEAEQEAANRLADQASRNEQDLADESMIEKDPKKRLKFMLAELRGMGEVEIPSKMEQELKKLGEWMEGADFSGIKVSGLDLRGANLAGAKFDGATIKDWWFQPFGSQGATVMDGASFRGATFENVNMTSVSARNADFREARLVGAGYAQTVINFNEADLTGVDFSRAELVGDQTARALNLTYARAEGAKFAKANLPNLDAAKTDMKRADFSGGVFKGIVFNGTDLRGAKFVGTDLSDMELSDQPQMSLQLIESSMIYTILEDADFSKAKLNGVDLSKARMRFCKFEGASLVNADLEGGNFVGSDFSGANFTGAVLKRANFAGVNFKGAKFKNVDMEDAHTAGVDFSGFEEKDPKVLPTLPFSTKKPKFKEKKPSEEAIAAATGSKTNFAGEDLKGASFQRQRLYKVDFSGANLREADFDYAELGECNFSLAELQGASFRFARIYKCVFDEVVADNIDFYGATFQENSFQKAKLANSNFEYTGRAEFGSGYELNFTGADLTGASFYQNRLCRNFGAAEPGPSTSLNFDNANLSNVNAEGSWMQNIRIKNANLTGLNAKDADWSGFFANWSTIWSGADFTNAWVARGTLSLSDAADKKGITDFAKARWVGANLAGTGYSVGTKIGATDFTGAVFSWAPWVEKNQMYVGSQFHHLNLAGSIFKNADLRGAVFSNTDLKNCDMSGADVRYSYWALTDNSSAGDRESNLGPLFERYTGINFTDAKLGGADVKNGTFTGSFKNASFGEEIKVNAKPANASYMPDKNYVVGFPEDAR